MIRKAEFNDASAIADLLTISWQTNFKGIIPDHYLNQMNSDDISKQLLKAIDNNQLFVAEKDDLIIGFVGCGKNRIKEFQQYESELHAIHVHPNEKGNGIGRILFNTAQKYLRKNNKENMILAVLEENEAKGFYEKLGGNHLGFRYVYYGNKKLIESIYNWNL